MKKACKNRLAKTIAIILGIAMLITLMMVSIIHAKREEDKIKRQSFEYGSTYGLVTGIIKIMKDANKISLDDYYNFNVAHTKCQMELSKESIEELNDIVYDLIGDEALIIPFDENTDKPMFWLGSSVELTQIALDMAYSSNEISEDIYEKMLAEYTKIMENPTEKEAIAYLKESLSLITGLDVPITGAGNGLLAIPANFISSLFFIKFIKYIAFF